MGLGHLEWEVSRGGAEVCHWMGEKHHLRTLGVVQCPYPRSRKKNRIPFPDLVKLVVNLTVEALESACLAEGWFILHTASPSRLSEKIKSIKGMKIQKLKYKE